MGSKAWTTCKWCKLIQSQLNVALKSHISTTTPPTVRSPQNQFDNLRVIRMTSLPKGQLSYTELENQFATLDQFLRSRANTHGDLNIAGSLELDLDRVTYYTYRDLDQHVQRLASYFHSIGLIAKVCVG
jgi:hypothetical protein